MFNKMNKTHTYNEENHLPPDFLFTGPCFLSVYIQERISDRSRTSRRNSSRKKRKTQRAIEAIEKSSEKSSVLLKAHKWQSLHRARTGGQASTQSVENLQKDPWVSMVKGVLSQSRSSLNTISEEEGVCSPVGREVLEGWQGGGCVCV